jgi:colicin import membrane protein
MTAPWSIVNSRLKEDRWVQMMALSFGLHLAVFSTTLFIPQTTILYPSLEKGVYHVELVGPRSSVRTGVIGSRSGARGGAEARGVGKRTGTPHMLRDKSQRIAIKKKEAAPIVAKRISPKAIPKNRNKSLSPSKLIDRAISKIERKVEEEKTDHLQEKLSEIERNIAKQKATQPERIPDKHRYEGDSKAPFRAEQKGGLSGLSRLSGISPDIGKGIQLYQMEIESAIKNNWSYPVALVNLKGGKIPEAVVLVTVRSDGKILKARFKRRSHNVLFDDSVLKAIEKSDPLPGFPPGYRKSYEEVEISFNLKDLM